MVSLVFLTGCCTMEYPENWYKKQCYDMEQIYDDVHAVKGCNNHLGPEFETFTCHDQTGELHDYKTESFEEQYHPKEKDCKLNKHERRN